MRKSTDYKVTVNTNVSVIDAKYTAKQKNTEEQKNIVELIKKIKPLFCQYVKVAFINDITFNDNEKREDTFLLRVNFVDEMNKITSGLKLTDDQKKSIYKNLHTLVQQYMVKYIAEHYNLYVGKKNWKIDLIAQKIKEIFKAPYYGMLDLEEVKSEKERKFDLFFNDYCRLDPFDFKKELLAFMKSKPPEKTDVGFFKSVNTVNNNEPNTTNDIEISTLNNTN